MIQFGIRLHDVNTDSPPEARTLEARAAKAKQEGFTCVHLALGKVLPGVTFDETALTEGLAAYVRRVFAREGLDIAVLGCYRNLAHPDPEKLKEIQGLYCAHLRLASLLGAGVVGTETGAPNAAYRYESACHGEAALAAFLRGLEPVVDCAERYGVTLAIEPVWKHIVYSPARAAEVLRSVGSRNLRIIFDPVNLLSEENLDRREAVFQEAFDLLGDRIAVVHLKDYIRRDGELISVAAGTGEMDYTAILRYLKARKPWIQATLENTTNENAVTAQQFLEKAYAEA